MGAEALRIVLILHSASGQSNLQASPSPPKFSGEFEDVGLVEKEYTNARSRSSSRWLVLVLVSWVMFGSYYVSAIPAPAIVSLGRPRAQHLCVAVLR